MSVSSSGVILDQFTFSARAMAARRDFYARRYPRTRCIRVADIAKRYRDIASSPRVVSMLGARIRFSRFLCVKERINEERKRSMNNGALYPAPRSLVRPRESRFRSVSARGAYCARWSRVVRVKVQRVILFFTSRRGADEDRLLAGSARDEISRSLLSGRSLSLSALLATLTSEVNRSALTRLASAMQALRLSMRFRER